jgi:hypothetical protein
VRVTPVAARRRASRGVIANRDADVVEFVVDGNRWRRPPTTLALVHDRLEDQEFVHLASGAQAAEVVRETLRLLGRHENVLAMADAFAEGPLEDVDAGADSRVDWYKRINPELSADALPADDSDLWERVRARAADVMLWHGPHPVERIFAIRACWHLRDRPGRVHEVALAATGSRWREGRSRPAFYDAVAIAGSNATVRAWEQRAKIVDVSERAQRWERLRSEPGDWIRVLDGETIVKLPVTAYDTVVLEACADSEWRSSSRVVGEIIAEHPIGLGFLTWRIRELLGAGELEGRGGRGPIGLPDELRSVRPP